MGNIALEWVRAQNRLVARVIVLIELARYLGLFWVMEQPGSSVILGHEKFWRRRRRLGTKYIHTWMMAFGGDTPKGTLFYGDAPWLGNLGARMAKEDLKSPAHLKVSVHTIGSTGIPRTCGGPGLKATQAYPTPFGMEVALQAYSTRPG